MTIVNYKDFMSMAQIHDEIPNMNGLVGKSRDGVTDKQKSFLHQLGIGTTGLKYKGQASRVIEYALTRKNNGLATPGQMRALKDRGFQNIHCFSFENAAKAIENYDRFQLIRR